MGDGDAARRGPVRSKAPRNRVEDEAERFRRGYPGPQRHPDLHRDSAKRMGATTYEVASSHCAMLSHPDVVLAAIRNLVTSLQGSLAMA